MKRFLKPASFAAGKRGETRFGDGLFECADAMRRLARVLFLFSFNNIEGKP
ncbi:hypothetical protein PQQ51_14745 [Paraburkholderia xenovorans]|uniref:hypothetical protein n=1 Tax=Paraburkholderia xenovorans TaxID=36873 RepID=UPI0038BB307F